MLSGCATLQLLLPALARNLSPSAGPALDFFFRCVIFGKLACAAAAVVSAARQMQSFLCRHCVQLPALLCCHWYSAVAMHVINDVTLSATIGSAYNSSFIPSNLHHTDCSAGMFWLYTRWREHSVKISFAWPIFTLTMLCYHSLCAQNTLAKVGIQF